MSCAANELSTLPMVTWIKNITVLVMSACLLSSLGGCTFRPSTGVYDLTLSPPVDQDNKQTLQNWGPAIVIPAFETNYKRALTKPFGPYVLDTGDRIRVLIYREPELSHSYTVDQEGYISLPLVGAVKARGKTPREFSETLRSRLITDGYLKDPKVAIDIEKNRPFFIYGSVKNAGQYPFVSNMSAETAVAIAGGLSGRGIDGVFRVTRRSNGYIEKKDVPPEYALLPGDVVFVYSGLF